MAFGFAAARFWPATATYLIVALGTLGVAMVPESTNDRDPRPVQSLAVITGVSAIALSVVLIPALFAPMAGPMPIVGGPFGPLFLVLGAAVVVTQTMRVGPGWLNSLTMVALGAVYLAFALVVQLRVLSPTGILYFALFGAALIALPWERRRRRLIDGSSFGSQLTVALLGITIIVMTSTVAFLGDREERSTVAAQLRVNQALAEALSANVGEYVRHHQQGLHALATTPGLARLSREYQQALLRSATYAYSDVVSFSTFTPTGQGIARGDGRPPSDATGDLVLSAGQGVPTRPVAAISTRVGRPVFVDAAPLRDDHGEITAVLTVSVEASNLVDLLDRSSTPGVQAFIVDQAGTVIAHSRGEVAQERPSFAERESVQHLVTGNESAGSTIDMDDGQQILAGYARVERIGWGVVVERPASVALAAARTSREIAYALLMLAIAVAAGVGHRDLAADDPAARRAEHVRRAAGGGRPHGAGPDGRGLRGPDPGAGVRDPA